MGKEKLFGQALHLPVFKFNGRETAEDRNRNLELAALGIDFVDPAVEIGERSVVDANFLADGILHLGDFLAVGRLDARPDLVDLGLAEGSGVLAADEAD